MGFDSGSGWNIGPFDVSIIGYISGLKLYQCVNWLETETHGGDISVNQVTTLFDYITDAQDIAGYTDYRKVHIKNTLTTPTGDCYVRPVLSIPEVLLSRLSVTVAVGLDYDDMSNKPVDGSFNTVIPVSLAAGAYQPMWIKRTITAAEGERVYYTNLPLAFTVSTE